MMWEIIEDNKRKSFVLIVAMAACLLAFGYAAGYALEGVDGAWFGMALASFVWTVMLAVSFTSGSSILLASSHAKEITPDIAPQLYNVVEEMKIAANLPALPKIYLIDEPAPNAFATGLSPGKSSVAVTAGLLARLDRDELQGVIAHEMSHILNRDVRYMTLAGVMLGSLQLLSQAFLRGLWYSGRSSSRYRSSSSSSSSGGAQAVFMLAALLLAILGPVLAQLFYFSLSRRREYLADASAARLTRYPEGLASALEKIASSPLKLEAANDATSPFYIADPSRQSLMGGLTSTHPPIEKRILVLRAMQGAAYVDYARACEGVLGKKKGMLPASALAEKGEVPLRAASPRSAPDDMKGQTRSTVDLMRAINGFQFLVCACGLKMKISAEDKRREFRCPRCARTLRVPQAELAGVQAALEGSDAATEEESLFYLRQSPGWETFACVCGRTLQLSPDFGGTHLQCPDCGKKIRIENRGTAVSR